MRSKFIGIFLIFIMIFNNIGLTAAAYSANNNESSYKSIITANKYAKIGHDAYDQKQFLKAAQYYEKAYNLSKNKVYQDNFMTAYTSYAYNLAATKDFENALKYGNKLLFIKPNDQNTKELMSEIYYSRSMDYFYNGIPDKARNDLEESLKFSVNKEQTDRAKDALAKIDIAVRNRQIPAARYQETQNGSVPEIVGDLENKIYGKSTTSAPIQNRISTLEKDTLGKTYDSDSLMLRIERLKRTIYPDYSNQAQPQSQSNPSANTVYDDTYISEIIRQSDGKITIFGKMPIMVYINDCNVKPYKNFYKDEIGRAHV